MSANPGNSTDATAKSGLADRWEWQQLANAVSCRFGQDGVLWAIIGSFWSTNAVLLVALFATGKLPTSLTVKILVCSAGLGISLVWLVMQAAALRRVIWYEGVMKQLETDLNIEPNRKLISGVDPEGGTGSRILPRARNIMPLAPPIAVAAWGIGLLVAICRG